MRAHSLNISCNEKMVRQGYIRPVLLMMIGWYIGTRQMIKKHSDDPNSAIFLLHPAYCFFYTMFSGAAFILIYNEWDRREGPPDPAIKCSDYFYDTYDKFGFITDEYQDSKSGDQIFRANNYLFRMLCVFAAQMLVAYVFAWSLRRRSGKIKDTKTFKTWIFRYSTTALAVGLGTFVLVTLMIPKDDEPGYPQEVPCAFNPSQI